MTVTDPAVTVDKLVSPVAVRGPVDIVVALTPARFDAPETVSPPCREEVPLITKLPADSPPCREEVPPITKLPPDIAPVEVKDVAVTPAHIVVPNLDSPPTVNGPNEADPVVFIESAVIFLNVAPPDTSSPFMNFPVDLNVDAPTTSRIPETVWEPRTIEPTTSNVPEHFALINRVSPDIFVTPFSSVIDDTPPPPPDDVI